MLRMFICAALALVLFSGLGVAAEKAKGKKGNTVHGTIKKVDTKAGTLTIAVKAKKKSFTDKEFKLAANTKVVVAGESKTKLTGPEALTNAGFKEGAAVTVVTDQTDATKVMQVKVGAAKKSKKAT
jgi:hypothetical protein